MLDLFGNEIAEDNQQPKKPLGKYQLYRIKYNYRISDDKDKKCKNCIYCVRCCPNNKNYYKCSLQGITACISSDISLKYVCDNFKGESEGK